MADKLMILLVDTDPFDGTTLVTIVSQATVAAAMEFDVELLLTGQCWVLAKENMARSLELPAENGRTVADLLHQAHEAGVKIKVCPPPHTEWSDGFLEAIDETVGNAYIISEAMDNDTVIFTY